MFRMANCAPLWCSIHRLRETVSTEHTSLKQKELDDMPKASHGYGGKFGVQQDRMDKVRESSRKEVPVCSKVLKKRREPQS